MSNPKPMPEYRRAVRDLVKTGEWEHSGRDSGGHGILTHIPSGRYVTFACHGQGSSDGARRMRRDAEAIMGRRVFGLPKKARDRRPPVPVPVPDLSQQVEAMWDRRARMIASVEDLASDPSSEAALKAAPLLAAIGEVETELGSYGETVEPYTVGADR